MYVHSLTPGYLVVDPEDNKVKATTVLSEANTNLVKLIHHPKDKVKNREDAVEIEIPEAQKMFSFSKKIRNAQQKRYLTFKCLVGSATKVEK